MRKGRIGFITDCVRPEIRSDDEIWAESIRHRGYEVINVPWDIPRLDWDSFECLVFRSTWNYFEKRSEFLKFLDALERIGVPTFNSISTVRWNHDKRYLEKLQEEGVPVIPTLWIKDEHEVLPLKAHEAFHEAKEWVIKPTVSGSAAYTFRVSSADTLGIREAIQSASERGWVMIQPFLEEIQTEGEWSLLYAGDQFLYAVRKLPKTGDYRVQEEHGGKAVLMDPPQVALVVADDVIQRLPEKPLYARIDGVIVKDQFQVMEVEVLEPALWLKMKPKAAEALTDELMLRLQ